MISDKLDHCLFEHAILFRYVNLFQQKLSSVLDKYVLDIDAYVKTSSRSHNTWILKIIPDVKYVGTKRLLGKDVDVYHWFDNYYFYKIGYSLKQLFAIKDPDSGEMTFKPRNRFSHNPTILDVGITTDGRIGFHKLTSKRPELYIANTWDEAVKIISAYYDRCLSKYKTIEYRLSNVHKIADILDKSKYLESVRDDHNESWQFSGASEDYVYRVYLTYDPFKGALECNGLRYPIKYIHEIDKICEAVKFFDFDTLKSTKFFQKLQKKSSDPRGTMQYMIGLFYNRRYDRRLKSHTHKIKENPVQGRWITVRNDYHGKVNVKFVNYKDETGVRSFIGDIVSGDSPMFNKFENPIENPDKYIEVTGRIDIDDEEDIRNMLTDYADKYYQRHYSELTESIFTKDLLCENVILDSILNELSDEINKIIDPDSSFKPSFKRIGDRILVGTISDNNNKLRSLFVAISNHNISIKYTIPGFSWINVTNMSDLRRKIANWRQGRLYPGSSPGSKRERKQIVNAQNDKYFPRSIYYSNKEIPGRLASQGTPYTLHISSKYINPKDAEKIIPDELYNTLNLHKINRKNFLGWIGGSIDHNNKIMYIDEVQSDLMQRTVQFASKESIDDKIKDAKEAMRKYRIRLAKLRSNLKSAPASDSFRLISDIEKMQQKIQHLIDKSRNIFPQFAHIRSKVENLFKNWIDAFYHDAFVFAKKNDISKIAIISSDKIRSIWSISETDESSIYKRAYDNMAKKFGGVKKGDWWWIDFDGMNIEEQKMDYIRKMALLLDDVNRNNGLTLFEGIKENDVLSFLRHNGFTPTKVLVKDPESEFKRLDLVISKIIDGVPKMVGMFSDLDKDTLQRHLSNFERLLKEPEDIQVSDEDEEELFEDAHFLITAGKMVGDTPFGVAIFSIDDPRYQFDLEGEGEDNIEPMAVDELESMFNT